MEMEYSKVIKKVALAWDPDFTKTTPAERARIDEAAAEMEGGDYIPESAVNWD